MGASVISAPNSSSVGKGGTNASTSGQPRMGQPNIPSQYGKTLGGWDNVQIGSSNMSSGKSGKGSGIQPFQPKPFQMPPPVTTPSVTTPPVTTPLLYVNPNDR